jgi:hypothetical protein
MIIEVLVPEKKRKIQNSHTHPNTILNGKISNNMEALMGKCFSSRVMVSDASVNARLSNVSWKVT